MPIFRVPLFVMVNVPVEVICFPPSSNILADVTSPIVKVLMVIAAPRFTPVALLLFTVANVDAAAGVKFCVLPDPLKFIVLVFAVNVPLFVQPPAMLIAEDPAVIEPDPLRFPVRFIVGLFVFNAVALPIAQLPAMLNVPDAGVFVPEPENVRFW